MHFANASLVAVTMLALVHPALARDYEVLDRDFVVITSDADGESVATSTDIVPLIAGTCYEWQLKLAKAKLPVSVTELFTLPGAPSDWGSTDTTSLSADGRSITTQLELQPAESWIWHTWCVLEGDPAGPHEIVVMAGERELARFDFTAKSAHLGSTKSKKR
ncbi:hypothetical protein WH87_11630 [Devosia epidermidihirudinis]|uniref:PLAT domain-containing protein n=1 Tax=Devosia epidermidihirudinis TaxID=1293439 RepID=A0A0F5QB61_9HYPH|nr:hypothetical protein [Devosia epidermidihirudinis]KKC38232.1 hypothetical protein WH87_11630 [Devosia epidermidihirudinis]